MLDGLNEAAFAKASHAYGKAADVPEFLRGLASKSAKVRSDALFELSSAICHQGTLYSATALAIPPLLELVASAKVKDRAGILKLLADIVTLDDHEQFLLHGYPEELTGKVPAAFQRALTAVRKGAGTIGELLGDDESEVRSAAAFLLAWLPKATEASRVAEALKKERDDAVKASLILALGFLDPKARFEKELGAKSVLVKTAAALATSTVKKGEIDAKTKSLIAAAAGKESLKVAGMLFTGGDLAVFAVKVLPALADTTPALIDAVAARGQSAQFAANVVVRQLFEVRGPAPVPKYGVERRDQEEERLLAALPMQPSELDEMQHRLVEALAKLPGGFDHDLVKGLGERGLPGTIELLRRWLEGPKAAPKRLLDRTVLFCDKEMTLGALYVAATIEDGDVKPAELAAIETATTPDERVRLALEGLAVIEVPWSAAVALELLWRNAPAAATESIDAAREPAKKGHLHAVAVGVALASRANAAKKPPPEEVDGLLQQAYGYWRSVRDAVATLPLPRREAWLLEKSRDDRAQPAESFTGAWQYWPACPTKRIADRALAHVAEWKPRDAWGGARKKFADPMLGALAEAFRIAGNKADADRLAAALAALRR